jgi:hypothetical protein
MKATLTYNLDDEDDRKAHLRSLKSLDMTLALFKILYTLPRELRDERREDPYNEGVNEVFQKIVHILTEHNIELDDLID